MQSGHPPAQPPAASTAKPPVAASSRIFEEALKEFKKELPQKQLVYFESVDFQDVEDAIEKIEFDQRRNKKIQNIARIKPFLNAMMQYGKVIEVFLNPFNFVAYIWGPIKFLLTISSTFMEAFEYLLSAYEELGECLPLYTQYEKYFQNNPHMQTMLGYVYRDLLMFHARVYKVMSGSMWKTIFTVTLPNFKAALTEIRSNFVRHKGLVESQAGLLHFDEYRKDREIAEKRFLDNEREENRRQRIEVLEWLAMTSAESTPSSDQEQFSNKRKDYPTSGQWLGQCQEYQEWSNPQASNIPVIWLYGIPGAGKTVLASYIIEQICSVRVFSVGWYYCKFGNKDKSTLLAVTRGIIAQLLMDNDQLRPYIVDARHKSTAVKLISPQAAKDLMTECLQVLERTCIIIDGLDECDRDERKEIIVLFTKLAKNLNEDKPGCLRILFVSTDEDDIRKPLSKAVHIVLKETHNLGEMQDYARIWSKKIQELHDLTDQESEGIATEVIKRAQGMYLFCYLVFDNLYGQLTREGLELELQPDSLPNGLGDAYDKILHRIDTHPQRSYRVYAGKILGWLACSRRPLKWHEIQGALCVGSDGTFDLIKRRLRVGAKELCGALVEVQSEGSVEFVHSSAREYLIRHHYQTSLLTHKESFIDLSGARYQAALTCVRYLALDCFRTSLGDDQVYEFVQKGYYCFQDYAVVYWYDHIKMCTTESNILPPTELETLLAALNTFLMCNWEESSQTKPHKKLPARLSQQLKIFKHDRFPEVFPKLIRFGSALDNLYSASSPMPFLNFRTPVQRARVCLEFYWGEQGCSETQMIQYYGHGFNYFKCSRQSCLHFLEGFKSGDERDKHELSHDRSFRCPETTCPSAKIGFALERELQAHINSQHPENILFEDASTHDECTINASYGGRSEDTLLIVEAAEEGQLNIVKTLIQRGLNVNARDPEGMTALHKASLRGHDKLVHLLANAPDIDISAQDDHGSTALHLAIENGHSNVANLLISMGTNLALYDDKMQTALHLAISTRNTKLVRLLMPSYPLQLLPQFDENCALSLTAQLGYGDIMEGLLPYLRTNSTDDYKKILKAIKNAAQAGYFSIVRNLLIDDRVVAILDHGFGGFWSECCGAALRLGVTAPESNATDIPIDIFICDMIVFYVSKRQVALYTWIIIELPEEDIYEASIAAARQGYTNIIALLVDYFDRQNYPMLGNGMIQGRIKLLDDLLHTAVHTGQIETVEVLLEHQKANPMGRCMNSAYRVPDHKGSPPMDLLNTALACSVRREFFEISRLILRYSVGAIWEDKLAAGASPFSLP